MDKDKFLLFCNMIITVAMATFAFETYQDSNIVLTVIFATTSVVVLAIVVLSFLSQSRGDKS